MQIFRCCRAKNTINNDRKNIEIVSTETNELHENTSEEFPVSNSIGATSTSNVVTIEVSRALQKSASNKFNDIELVEDVKNSCVERREPNGTTYFIEIDPSTGHERAENQLNEFDDGKSDADIVDEILGKVLNLYDEPSSPTKNQENDSGRGSASTRRYLDDDDDENDDEEIGIENSTENDYVASIKSDESIECEEESIQTRAIVHSTNDLQNSTISSESSLRSIDRESLKPLPNFSIGVYRSSIQHDEPIFETTGRNKAFKERLERLLGAQNSNEIPHVAAKSDESLPRRLSLKRTASAMDFENETMSTPPTTTTAATIEFDASSIPVAPKFDADLFNTIGRRLKQQQQQQQHPQQKYEKNFSTPTNMNVIDRSFGRLHRTSSYDNLSKIGSNERRDAAEEAPKTVNEIKEKLNDILARGKPVMITITDETTAETDANIVRRPKVNDNIEPFDTVKKQKQKFTNVLKAINSDVRNSLHRTNSNASADIHRRSTDDINNHF